MSKQFGRVFGADGNDDGRASDADAASADTAPPAQEAPSRYETVLGAGCRVEGKLVCAGPARIAGAVNGEIVSDNCVDIDEGASVEGDLNVAQAAVGGRVTGNIAAADRVTLAPTALIDGDIRTPSLSIAEGAQIMGRIEVKPGAGGGAPGGPAAPIRPAPSDAGDQR